MSNASSDPNYLEMAHTIIGPLIPSGAPVALFDFPNYSNVGDSAIWLGEEYYLDAKLHAKVLAVDDNQLAHRKPPALPENAIVLLQGGGNLGDLYSHHQAVREYVITHYRRHRVIQFPQSIHFQDSRNEARCRGVFNSHPDFHLVVRDRVSLELAQRLYDGPTYLCPDMALCLGCLPRPTNSLHPILGLLRTDKEKVTADELSTEDSNGFVSVDWLDEPLTLFKRLTARLDRIVSLYPQRLAMLHRLKRPLYHRLAGERLKRGCDLLGSGQVVIADRLHAHILCVLMGIPHVVLDNSYGKIGNFRDTWRTGEGLCERADTLAEALERARGLLDRTVSVG